MPPRKLPDIIPFFFISISLIGLCLLAMLTFNISIPRTAFPWQKQLTGSIFGAICLLGTMAGIFPSRCSRMLHFESRNRGLFETKQASTGKITLKFEGHHPTCGKFSAHVFQFGSKTYCAGCIGLVIGAIISFLGSLLYFFAGFHVGEGGTFIFWLGFLWVAGGLLQYNLFNMNRGVAHLSLNAIFVLGTFFLLVGVNEITGNLFLEFYLLTLIVYWILARIMLSQLEHRKICLSCNIKLCSFT